MPKKVDWDLQAGRRLHLRQLHVFLAVVKHGSMAMAARQLGVSTPTVSEILAHLEQVVGVKLFDRSPKGVEPTQYGQALHRRALIVFDELKQGINEIELLADPGAGEVRIACPLGIARSIVPHIFERFAKEYPRVVLHFDEVVADSTTRDLGALRDRKYDLILGRGGLSLDASSSADLDIHPLFDDRLVIVAGERSRWAGSRRELDLADLVAEPWIMQAPQTGNYRILAQGFAARGLAVPQAHLVTTSMSVITHFLADGPFLTAIPWSVAHYASLKILAVDVPAPPWPVNIVTLKHRIIGPTTAAFIECARDFTKPLRERSRGLPGVVGSEHR
jgi:DNA-binding transcriptional LysR family regulator